MKELEEESDVLKMERLKMEYDLKMMEVQAERERLRTEAERERWRIEAHKETERLRLEAQVKLQEHPMDARRGEATVSLLPEFVDGEAHSFFAQFEKVAKLKEWRAEDWALLVQSKLTGRAREAYVNLSPDQSVQYEAVKKAVLRLSKPEAYRRSFRGHQKSPGTTYEAFASELKEKLDSWCQAEGAKSVDDVKEMLLKEEFLKCVQETLRTEVVDNEPKTMARLLPLLRKLSNEANIEATKRKDIGIVD